jgi:hypothetical protein
MLSFVSRLVVFLVVLGVQQDVWAGSLFNSIARGQQISATMNSGDTWTIYYTADGTQPTLTALEPYGWWAALLSNRPYTTPVTAMTIYVLGNLPGNRCGWIRLGNYWITPWTSGVRLTAGRWSQYMIVISNYQQPTPVYFQIR